MSDTPSSILLTREQSTGSNTNLWGGYLITTQRTTERASKGYQALAVTGDATISWTNYSAANDGAVAFLKLTGTAAGTLTFPAYQNFLAVWNASTQSITIKCSGGTGVTLLTGQRALLWCDAVDYYNAGPTLAPTSTQSTAANAYALWGAVETAIATAGLPATAGTILVSAVDTAAGYIGTKLVAGDGISLTDSGAGNSTLTAAVLATVNFSSLTTTQLSGLTGLQISASGGKVVLTPGAGYVGGFLNGGTKSAQFTPVAGSEYNCDFTAAAWTVNLSGMTAPQIGHRIKLNCFGNFQPFLLGTVNGLTNLSLDAGFNGELAYSSASWGWN